MAQKLSVLGVDIAKLMFHVVEMNDKHEVVLQKRMARRQTRCPVAEDRYPRCRSDLPSCDAADQAFCAG
jgi:hypothetical protein